MNKNTVETIRASAREAADTVRSNAEKAVETAREFANPMAAASKAWLDGMRDITAKLVAAQHDVAATSLLAIQASVGTRSIKDLVDAQAKTVRETTAKSLEHGSTIVSAMTDTARAVSAPMLAHLTEKLRKAA